MTTRSFAKAATLLWFCLLLLPAAVWAQTQTTTYHLHAAISSTPGQFQLQTAGPSAATASLMSGPMVVPGDYQVAAFDTQAGVPNTVGSFPTGSQISFRLWMQATKNSVAYPEARVYVNNSSGALFCGATAATPLTTTLQQFNFSCATTTTVSMQATDRFYLWVGAAQSGSGVPTLRAMLSIEGTLNGNYDSQIIVPVLPPLITAISPNVAGNGLSVTVSGANFGNTQGTSTVAFNGTAAQVSIWSDTGIAVTVPNTIPLGAVTVTVTANGMTSSGAAFTVAAPPVISTPGGLSPNSGASGASVTISGSHFGTSVGTVSFNWASASISSWNDTSIRVTVPYGTTTGPVVVQNAGGVSNSVSFTVSNPTAPAVSLQSETAINTSAPPNFSGLQDFRTADPTTTNAPNTLGGSIVSNPFDAVPAHIAKARTPSGATTPDPLDIHSLMYAGFNGKIFAETQQWFCGHQDTTYLRTYSSTNTNTFPQCGQHLEVAPNYDSNVHGPAAVDDMYQRGFDGFMADSSGGQNDCGPEDSSHSSPCSADAVAIDKAIQAMEGRITGQYSTALQFFLIEDQSAFDGKTDNNVNNCNVATDLSQPKCIVQKIRADISYFNATYFGLPEYLKGPTSNPLLAFFVAEEQRPNPPTNAIDLQQCNTNSCNVEAVSSVPHTPGQTTTCTGTFTDSAGGTVSNCWPMIWQAVFSNSPVSIDMMFRNATAFDATAHPHTAAAYAWVNPNDKIQGSIKLCTQNDWKKDFDTDTNGCPIDSSTRNYIDDFYKQAAASTTVPVIMGIAKKGFDREDAAFETTGLGKVTSQQCGQVWLNSFAEPSASTFFGTGKQISYMVAGTWDDYEEGTEIETGIDNCLSLGATAPSAILYWSPLFSDVTGTENTLSSYTLFDYNSSTQQLTPLQSIPPGTHQVDLNSLSLANGSHSLYVEAIGKPSIINHLSPAVTWTAGVGRGFVTIEGCTAYNSSNNCTAIQPSLPAPYDSGTITITVNGGTAGTCVASVGFLAHGPQQGPRDLALKLASNINTSTACSGFLSATAKDNIVFIQALTPGSSTNYSYQSSHTGLSFITVDAYGGVFQGGR